jgi:hypothetical protein
MPQSTAAAALNAQLRRKDASRRDEPTLRARVRSAWRGEERLSWAFWGLTVAGSVLLSAAFSYASVLLLPFRFAAGPGWLTASSPFDLAYLVVYAVTWLSFLVICIVAVWRCGPNVEQPHWTYVARIAVLLWCGWHLYGIAASLVPTMSRLPGNVYVSCTVMAIVAAVAVTRSRGGAGVLSIVTLVLFFAAAAVLGWLAAAVALFGLGVLDVFGASTESLTQVFGWATLFAMFYVFPSLAAAVLTCFTYALADRASSRFARASFVFVLLSAGVLTIAAVQRYFT